MKDLDLKEHSLILYFAIAFALPAVTTLIVMLMAGAPSGLVVNELSAAAIVVVVAMVHAPTIAAIIVVFRSHRLDGVRTLFRQLKHWKLSPRWYLTAIFIFPATILIVLYLLSSTSSEFTPAYSLSVMAIGALYMAFWEEIGWTGFATPVMLRRFSPLQVGLLLGFLHALWHLPAGIYGAGSFHGDLYVVNFLATSVGIIGLRVVTVWIYQRTGSLVLGWLTHAGFTGGQLSLVPLQLSATATVVWNTAFSVAVTAVVVLLIVFNRDMRFSGGD